MSTVLIGVKDDFNLKLARELNIELIDVELRVFPDGELCPRILVKSEDDLKGKKAIVSLRMKAGEKRPNDYLMNNLLILRNLRRIGVREAELIIPYLPYARQDEVFRPGEPLSSKFVADMLVESGVKRIYTVTTHLHRIPDISKFFNVEAFNISGFPPLAEEIKKRFKLENPVILAPDEEAVPWAKEVAKILNADYTYLVKFRDRETGEITVREAEKKDLKGRDVVVVDDMVSTGGTMVKAMKYALNNGCNKLISCFVHAVLVQNAKTKLEAYYPDLILTTDTIKSDLEQVTVTHLIAEKVKPHL